MQTPSPRPEADTSDTSRGRYGVVKIESSGKHRDRVYTDIKELSREMIGQSVWVRARLHSSRTAGEQCVAVLRQTFSTVQLTVCADGQQVSQHFVDFTSSITRESIVDVFATVARTAAPVEACSVRDVELVGAEVWTVSAARAQLPFQVEDASRPDSNDSGAPLIDQTTRLDNRVLDLRTPANQAIFRIQAGVCRLFRESLTRRGFFEIHVPKLVTGSLCDTYAVPHFGKTVFLGVTLQFHKQAAVAADFDRVFTIGAVYRPEEIITHRHLVEYIGLDLEMTFKYHYHEVLDVIGQTFTEIFHGLRNQYASEIATVAQQYKAEPFKFLDPALRLEFPQAVQMLKEAGVIINEKEPLTMPHEKLLGRLVRDKYDTDFFILDKYPVTHWIFWAMPDADDPTVTNSYDMFMRGEEVLSGCQRVNEPKLLLERGKLSGFNLETLHFYLDSFDYGCPPHAGGGIGLERVVMLFLGLDDVRKTSMFPRDRTRLIP